MPATTPGPQPYVLGDAAREQERLRRQGGHLRALTERALRDAGIVPGMRVLDVGCGTGEVTAIAADLVGPAGSVVGLDRSPAMLEAAARHVAALGVRNARFVEADAASLSLGTASPDAPARPFDAVVGRLVLMYVADPAAVLRRARAVVRPGGVVAFLDLLALPAPAWPARPVYARCMEWLCGAIDGSGARSDMALRLSDAYVAAGFAPPEVRLEGVPIVGADPARIAWLVETVRTLVPAIERLGLAAPGEVDADTLAERLAAEAEATGGTVCGCVIGSAWARSPGGADA